MIWINAGGRGLANRDGEGDRATLLKTYTFYLRRDEPGGRTIDSPPDPTRDPFEPVLCRTDGEARAQAVAMLGERADLAAIDVCFGHDQLFRVSRRAT